MPDIDSVGKCRDLIPLALLKSRDFERLASDHSADGDQHAGADEADDQIGDRPAKGHVEHNGQDEIEGDGAHDAQENVHHEPHIAAHEPLCQPACEAADQDCAEYTYAVQIHRLFSIIV